MIRTTSVWDRETKSAYEVQVSATDGGGRVGFTTFRVTVMDEADQAPMFHMTEYKANAYASLHQGSNVLTVCDVNTTCISSGIANVTTNPDVV